MTTFNTVEQANKLFESKIKLAAKHVGQSHPALVFNMLDAIKTQDVDGLNTMYAKVCEHMPALVSRFKGYVLVSLDGIEFETGEFVSGELITESEYCSYGTPWNTPKAVKRDTTPKAIDPRKAITQLANKLAKRGLDAEFKAHAPSKAAKQVAAVMAKALADLEAIHAGTYGKAATPKKAAKSGNVVGITKAA